MKTNFISADKVFEFVKERIEHYEGEIALTELKSTRYQVLKGMIYGLKEVELKMCEGAPSEPLRGLGCATTKEQALELFRVEAKKDGATEEDCNFYARLAESDGCVMMSSDEAFNNMCLIWATPLEVVKMLAFEEFKKMVEDTFKK